MYAIRSESIRRFASGCFLGSVVLFSSGSVLVAQKFECLVEPYLDVSVSSAVPGILDEVRVDRGSVVKKGQVLAQLKSDVAQAHQELVKARADSQWSERNFYRN